MHRRSLRRRNAAGMWFSKRCRCIGRRVVFVVGIARSQGVRFTRSLSSSIVVGVRARLRDRVQIVEHGSRSRSVLVETLILVHRASSSSAGANLHQQHGSLAIAGFAHGLLRRRRGGGLFGCTLALRWSGRRVATSTASSRSNHGLAVGVDLDRDDIGMVGSLRSRIGGDALSSLDDGLLHANRAMSAVQLVVETASVANVVAVLVASPEWSGGRLTIGAAECAYCALVVLLLVLCGWRRPLCWASRRSVLAGTWFALAGLEGVREVVVVGWASAAAGGTAGAVAETVTGAGARLGIVVSGTSCTGGGGERGFARGWAYIRSGGTTRGGAMHAVRLDVETAGVADGAAVGSPPPERSGCDAAVGTPHACMLRRTRRDGALGVVRLARNMLRAVGARVGVVERSCAVGLVRGFDGSRGTRVAFSVWHAARVVLVACPVRSGRDGSRMLVNIVMRLDTILACTLVTVGRVIVAHGGGTAHVGRRARVAEGVAHVQACSGARRGVGRAAMMRERVWMFLGQLSRERRDGRKVDADGFVGMAERRRMQQRAVGLRSRRAEMRSFRALRTVSKSSDGRLRTAGRMKGPWIAEEAASCASGGEVCG